MCGLAGFAGAGDRSDLADMIAAQTHRGPDGEGWYVDPQASVYLGHRRLAIRDHADGAQPMWNADRTIGVVFNGEIYNHQELRSHLTAQGYVFATGHSDTEVLVHGYAAWGDALPERLNGMFAFAVYDRRRRQIFLACDRFAEKPLFYARSGGVFAFASELRALTRHRRIDRSVALPAIQKFLAHGFLPAPHTLLRDAFRLPPGGRLTYDLVTGRVTQDRYWRFSIEPDHALDRVPEADLVEQLRHLLVQAVGRRLVSDVPLGCFLSGGLDSASVLALAARSGTAVPPTFTIGFADPVFDESAAAAAIAAHFGAEHHRLQVEPAAMDHDMPAVLASTGEPIGDATLLPTYLLSAFARRRVTVALTGDGSDELFAGYPQFAAMRAAGLYRRLVPASAKRGLRRLVDFLPASLRDSGAAASVSRGMAALAYPESYWNPLWLASAQPPDLAELFETPVRAEDLYAEALALWNGSRAASPVDRALEYYAGVFLPDNILSRADRGAMMASLESRAVFLDNDLVEFCRRLPVRFKLRGKVRKYLLRKAMTGWVPDAVLTRRKRPFEMPLTRWLRGLPSPSAVPGHTEVKAAQVERRWREHRIGRSDHGLFLWSWLSLTASLSAHAPEPARLAAE